MLCCAVLCLLQCIVRAYDTCFLASRSQVWSATSWRWLELKMVELGMLTHAGYKFSFVLDKSSMFSIISEQSINASGGVKEVRVMLPPPIRDACAQIN